jgi:ferric-dicitrate binding protein FerR (iron transport regulator)
MRNISPEDTAILELAQEWCRELEYGSSADARTNWRYWLGADPRHQMMFTRAAWLGPRTVLSEKDLLSKWNAPVSHAREVTQAREVTKESPQVIKTTEQCLRLSFGTGLSILIAPYSHIVIDPNGTSAMLEAGKALFSVRSRARKPFRTGVRHIQVSTSSGSFVMMRNSPGEGEVLMVGGRAAVRPILYGDTVRSLFPRKQAVSKAHENESELLLTQSRLFDTRLLSREETRSRVAWIEEALRATAHPEIPLVEVEGAE